jgi:hypothetical protein
VIIGRVLSLVLWRADVSADKRRETPRSVPVRDGVRCVEEGIVCRREILGLGRTSVLAVGRRRMLACDRARRVRRRRLPSWFSSVAQK